MSASNSSGRRPRARTARVAPAVVVGLVALLAGLSLGTGWRGLWLDPDQGKQTSLQGLELARVQLGVDYRVSEDIAIAPVVGGSLTMFVSQDAPMTDGYTEIQDKKVGFVGFAGLAGRFDLGGRR